MKKKYFIIIIICFFKITLPHISLDLKEKYLKTLQGLYRNFDESFLIGMDYAKYKYLFNIRERYLNPIKNIYLKNNFSNLSIDNFKSLRIPKIIHQIWLGSPFPEKYRKWQKTWIKFHPDWEYKLWTEKEIDELQMYNRKIYNMAKNYGEKSDIARYEILYKYGGLYIDTDFECLKSFDALHYPYNFYTGAFALDKEGVIANGLIAAAPQHIIMAECIKKVSISWHLSLIVERTGPRLFRDVIMNYIDKHNTKKILILPPSYFYALPNKNKNKYTNYLKSESFAVHHWEGSWR